MNANQIAAAAIARSRRQNEIVHLPYDVEVRSALLREANDCLHGGWGDSDTESEFWGGEDRIGEGWRVHVAKGDEP
jgi:hypothetical protein